MVAITESLEVAATKTNITSYKVVDYTKKIRKASERALGQIVRSAIHFRAAARVQIKLMDTITC